MTRSLPRVEDGVLYPLDAAAPPVVLDSPAWYTWLEQHTAFAFVDGQGVLTVRKERGRPSGWYWKGYRRQAGQVRRAYLGRSAGLSFARLRAAAQALAGGPAPGAGDAPPAAPDERAPRDREALPRTKFFMPPPRPQRVQRTRLLDRLRSDPLPPVTLVAAPAGCGKTTLVADWITADRHSAAWLTLDAGDNDPVAFWTAVATALDIAQPGVSARVLDLLHRPTPVPGATTIALLINELSTHLRPDAEGRPVLLVLDDYHVIAQRAIHETMLLLIESLPPQLRLVLTSRIDPPLRLARLRVRAALLEIRAAALAFNEEEVAAFLTNTMGFTLPATLAATLAARTEGWVAALQLAALSLRRQPDPAAFLATFSGTHHHLLAYLVDEVFNEQPAAVQDFLLATSVLDRLSPELCAAVIDPAPAPAPPSPSAAVLRAQALLAEVDDANLFLIPLDPGRHWFRYHSLFGEMLRHRLHQRDPAGERVYRQRAGAWYAQAGYGHEAIGQALAAHDWEAAARLIEHFGDALWRHGELNRLESWLGALPPTLLRARPILGFLQATLLLAAVQYAAAEEWLVHVEQSLASADSSAPGLADPAAVAILRARVAAFQSQVARTLYADRERAEALARAALAQLPPDEVEWRAVATASLAAGAYVSDDLDAARQYYTETDTLSQRAGVYLLTFTARSRMVLLLYDGGQLRDAPALVEETRRLTAAWGVPDLPATSYTDWIAALLRYEVNDLGGAEALARRASTLAGQARLAEAQGFACIALSQILRAQGDPAGALEALEQVESLLTSPAGNPSQARSVRLALAAWRAGVVLADGPSAPGRDATTVRTTQAQWAAMPTSPEWPVRIPTAYWLFRATHLVPARALLLQGDPAGALAYLEPLCSRAEAVGAQALLIAALAVQAVALEELGRRAAARAALRRALDLGAAEGYARTLLDTGPALGTLLHTLAQELTRAPETSPAFLAYVDWLRAAAAPVTAASGLDQPLIAPPADPAPTGPGAGLTSRELAILRLLAAGGSNQEIADQLIIGVSTVKWYLRTIYDKLGSANRTQAVARARALGLLR